MTVNYLVRDSKKGKNGLAPIEVSIIVNGERKIITIDRRIKPSSFNSKTQKVKGDSETNKYLDIVKAKFFSLEMEMMQKNITITTDSIIDAFRNGLKDGTKGLLEYFQAFIDSYSKEATCSIVQYQKYCKTLDYLKSYIKEKTNKKEILLGEITPSFIEGFFKFLLKYNSNNTCINKMKQLKKILVLAKDDGLIDSIPFKMKMKKEKLSYTPLTIEEIATIKNKDFGIDRLNKVRDIIVFACYTGLAYADLKELTIDNIQGDVIIKKRHKTDVQSTIPLLPIAREILEKYDFMLPIPSNQKMNAYCKEIGDLCMIRKELHCHLFRHTFATILLNNGIDMVTVSKTMGHSNSRITESVYAEMQTNTIVSSVMGIADKICK